jgi:hypothetical protein
MEHIPSSSNRSGSHEAGKTVFTDHSGRKHVLCHRCGIRTSKSTYYDTCHKGKNCEQLVGQSRLTRLDPKLMQKNPAIQVVQLNTPSEMSLQRESIQVGDNKQKGGEQACHDSIDQNKKANCPVDANDQLHNTAAVNFRVLPPRTEGGSLDFPTPSCEELPQTLNASEDQHMDDLVSGSDETQTASEDEGNSQLNSDCEDDTAEEVQELAMDLLGRFRELGDEGFDEDLDIDEDDEQRVQAAAYLQKMLQRGELEDLADDDAEEGDDWIFESLEVR